MKKKLLVPLLSAFALVFSACSQAGHRAGLAEGESRVITDVWGRQVRIPLEVRTIITLGPGAPRIAAYLNVMDMLAGSEEYNVRNLTALRDYNPVHHERFRTLPLVGAGGGSGNNNAFPEAIVMLAPDVIIAGFERDAADELQAQTGIPVVSVRHRTGLAHESFYAAVRVFAETVGAQTRGEELLSAIDAYKEDLRQRTFAIPEDGRPRVYAGAVTFNGRRGMAGTYSHFGPLAAINAYNVADEAGAEGFIEIDLEQIIIWDPDVIFLDPGNMDLVNHEYQVNPSFFRSLRAVQQGRVYSMPAFNFAGTNITYALINAYFAGTVLFPQEFADIDIAEKAGEILYLFLGENTFDIMASYGLVYGRLTIGE
ncbi:MAG: ABC transporter substrate-binding protein [Spirochaetes bacterium]|nr:ABC transporter substrate-binding protein [Spirochaetota bacterium]